jgi:Metallo-peptidase family M12B Reprolysin-like
VKKKSTSQSAPARRSPVEGGFFNLRVLIASVFCLAGLSTTSLTASAQPNSWSVNNESRNNIATDKAVARQSFPKEFKLFNLNIEPLRQQLFSIVGSDARQRSTVIVLPNADGKYEEFEVFEASNFEPDLQARFPEIRAYSGKGITDKYATLKLSISPQGIQTMVFRTDKENEFIEPYSRDHTVYAVYKSQRERGRLPWTCFTEDKQAAADIDSQLSHTRPLSNTGELKTMRLAQSCTAEYSNYFGATNASQSALVYAAFNATLTRCNGLYERDLAIHLNLISSNFEDLIIFYDPATDPYPPNQDEWSSALQNLLNLQVGDANYDIGHLFGATGGGGFAGCIGCVCVDGQKGSGYTSAATPMGDAFDVDFVAHEVGHQMGANHTFTNRDEGTQVQKEVGGGITIMGYAGLTDHNPGRRSIDIFHEASIQQIQVNMASKTCPITTVMTANHPPVVAPVNNYTIPILTPFALTGSATDPEGDPITYCWEENDLHGGQTGAQSVAYATKPVGPNWLSFPATQSPTRLCPTLSTILAGLLITPPLPGGNIDIEALSSVSRTLNFRLTVRDNHPYVPMSTIGETQFTDMTVTVSNTSGPFQVTSPNTNVTWAGGSTQTIMWNVAGTTGPPVSCAAVNISLSTDGGTTFPTLLSAEHANDGSAALTIPNAATTKARVKVEAVGNIFFDISDSDFTITGPTTHPPFFTGEIALQNGVYYLRFPNGTPFGYYTYLTDPRWIYHFDMGYEYWFDANDGRSGIYFYDNTSTHFFYTSPSFPFPYLYDFTLNTVLYYYPDTNNPGHYTTNPRYFYNFATGQIITM